MISLLRVWHALRRAPRAAVSIGFIADAVLGDPVRWHPVAGFGRVAEGIERLVYAPSRARGLVFTAGLVLGATAAAEALRRRVGQTAAGAVVLWATLGGRSLRREALGVATALDSGSLEEARERLPALVGRDTQTLDREAICRAVVESVAENTADAITGPLVWFALAGPGGAAAYRAANTLDAMVGHPSERYRRFGWAAARLDDVMSWPAARLGALVTVAGAPAVGGSARRAWAVLQRYGRAHPSPNAGPMEAAFAGALGVRLGGPVSYRGRKEERPTIGNGRTATVEDIRRAAQVSALTGGGTASVCVLFGGAW